VLNGAVVTRSLVIVISGRPVTGLVLIGDGDRVWQGEVAKRDGEAR
jgi:hypothetical protein